MSDEDDPNNEEENNPDAEGTDAADGNSAEGDDGVDGSGDGADGSEEDLAAEWEAAMQQQDDTEADAADSTDVKAAPLEELKDEPEEGQYTPNLEVILDIPVTISMEVGSTQIAIRNLLQLNQGSVIELDRLAGEPLDVKVNGCLIAHGEVVMVNDKFGIRLTDVISQSERINKLK